MFLRIGKYAVKNTLRNTFLSFSTILVLTLLMFFINVLGLLQDIGNKLVDGINSKMTISLYLNKKYDKSSADVTGLIEDLSNFQGDVPDEKKVNVDYKTKESLINEYRQKEPELINILEKKNPFPNTIVISNIELTDYSKLNSIVENKLYLLSSDTDKSYFANYKTQYQNIQKVISTLQDLQIGLKVIILVVFVSIAIIIYSVTSNFIYYYRDEIYITKLVGGSGKFIYGPFVIQGMLYAVIAFLLNLLILYIALKNVNILTEQNGQNYGTFEIPNIILLAELLIFMCIGAVSGFLSSRKFLKQKIS